MSTLGFDDDAWRRAWLLWWWLRACGTGWRSRVVCSCVGSGASGAGRLHRTGRQRCVGWGVCYGSAMGALAPAGPTPCRASGQRMFKIVRRHPFRVPPPPPPPPLPDQCGLLHPLASPGPSLFVLGRHLGTFGVTSLHAGARIRLQLRLGRAHMTQLASYVTGTTKHCVPKACHACVPLTPESPHVALGRYAKSLPHPTLFALPARSEAGYSDPASQTLHVYLYQGTKSR
jgi:hypothetical protein